MWEGEERPSACDCLADRSSVDRRTFVGDVLAAGSGLFAALGMPRNASPLGIRIVRGPRASGGTARYEIPEVDGVTVDAENQIILARVQRSIFAFALSCPHQRSMLRWLGPEGRFQCPKHKSKYRPDGTFISGRATRHMDRHPLRLEGGELVVDLATIIKSDQNPTGWAAGRVEV